MKKNDRSRLYTTTPAFKLHSLQLHNDLQISQSNEKT